MWYKKYNFFEQNCYQILKLNNNEHIVLKEKNDDTFTKRGRSYNWCHHCNFEVPSCKGNYQEHKWNTSEKI